MGGHRVLLFDDRREHVRRVAAHVREALDAGGCGILFARDALNVEVASALGDSGIDVAELRARGRLTMIDADRELETLAPNHELDRARFFTVFGDLLELARALAGTAPIHVYGEAVDILWHRRLPETVRAVEAAWTQLRERHDFLLLCGYDARAFSETDMPVLRELTALHGDGDQEIAELENRARVLELEIQRREKLERRMHRLLALADTMAQARSEADIARLVVDEGRSAVGAVSSSLWLVEGDHLVLAAQSASVPGNPEPYRTIPLTLEAPVPLVARTSKPIFLGSLAEYAARYPQSHARVAPAIAGEHALAMLPVIGTSETLGVICFTFDYAKTFEASGQAFKAIVARQAALAIERARLQSAERRRRVEAELLYNLTATLNTIDDLGAMYEHALDAVIAGSGSQRAAILVFDPDHVMRFKASRGLSETYRRAVEGHSPWKYGDTEPRPVTVDDTETDPAWTSYREVFRAEGIRSLAFVPLMHQRRLIGKLMLYRDTARPFASDEIQLTETVAIHVAQAIERTRAYREEREAHLQAEEATRAREEILSVVSHDLRNPLGTVMMAASTLLALDVGATGHRVRTIAERVHRQAERMARLIEDLVDFAGIQSGRLSLERGKHAPDRIVAEARELFASIALERGLELTASLPPDLPHIECDPERVVQLISNLVSNALKVTPKGGRIAIGAEPKDREVVFFVQDTGPGIDPEELPNLFERFWRSKKASYKGAGLGLSIARGIVDAHGGRIWAESQVGVGSTFFFSLSSLGN